MAWRFRRTKKIAPGVRLNVGKKSVSVRVGGRGFGFTTGTSGSRVSAGIPGTGLYATKKLSGERRSRGSQAKQGRSGGNSATANASTVEAIGAAKETGVSAPTGWIVVTIIFVLMGLVGAVITLPLALITAFMAWNRFRSPGYRAVKAIRDAQDHPSQHADDKVREAARVASKYWTVQREAALYFHARNQPIEALRYAKGALLLYPGDHRLLLAMASDMGIAAGEHGEVIGMLEPVLPSLDPAGNDVDALLVSTLGLALYLSGESGKAMEVVRRLPLRRQTLSEPLLLGLCVRALARHAQGRRADAKRDLDRVYAMNPSFEFLKEAEKLMTDSRVRAQGDM